MAFWNSEKIRKNLNEIIILPQIDNVKRSSYELTLGKEAYTTSNESKTKQKLNFVGDSLCIPPGQFSILMTEEIVMIPDNAIGFISIKAGIKFKGLVNVSGFHVDPGFYGRLKFSVYNAGSNDINLSRGDSVFLLWLADLNERTEDLYNGGKYKENNISSQNLDDMEDNVASPSQLKKEIDQLNTRIKDIEGTIKTKSGIFYAVIIASGSILFATIGYVLQIFLSLK